jgi:hypothetical protein
VSVGIGVSVSVGVGVGVNVGVKVAVGTGVSVGVGKTNGSSSTVKKSHKTTMTRITAKPMPIHINHFKMRCQMLGFSSCIARASVS